MRFRNLDLLYTHMCECVRLKAFAYFRILTLSHSEEFTEQVEHWDLSELLLLLLLLSASCTT